MESLRESLVKWPVIGKLTRLSASGCAAEDVRSGREESLGCPCISVWKEGNSSRDRGAWSSLGQSQFMVPDQWWMMNGSEFFFQGLRYARAQLRILCSRGPFHGLRRATQSRCLIGKELLHMKIHKGTVVLRLWFISHQNFKSKDFKRSLKEA